MLAPCAVMRASPATSLVSGPRTMAPMHSTGPHTARPPRRRQRVLLVLAVLLGLLGMHALGPRGGMGHGWHGDPARHSTPLAAAAVVAQDHCPDGDGHCGGGLPHHADATCASGALNGGPQLPALIPDPVAVPVPDRCPRSRAATGPEGARAPPCLAELQLLRI